MKLKWEFEFEPMASELDFGLSGTAGGFSQGDTKMNSNTARGGKRRMKGAAMAVMAASPRGERAPEAGQTQQETAKAAPFKGGGFDDSDDEDDEKPVVHLKSLGMAVVGAHRREHKHAEELMQSSPAPKKTFKSAALTSIAVGARRDNAQEGGDGNNKELKPSAEPVLPPKSRRVPPPSATGDADMAGFPVLRLDQIALVETEMLEKALEEVPELVVGMHEDAARTGEPVPKLASYLQRQIDAMNAELTKRHAEERVFSILQVREYTICDLKEACLSLGGWAIIEH